jgi:hypothetical protein
LKQKTVPSSFMARCRLFLERDSKIRHLTTRFGATFRNSK